MHRIWAVAIVALLASAPHASAGETSLCGRFAPSEVGGTVEEPRLVELSGLVASRVHEDVLWAHNDSGGAPELFTLTRAGAPIGAFAVPDAEAVDWEALGIGPGPEANRSYLYVGDIGDNAEGRESVTVYRVPEPTEALTGDAAGLDAPEVIEVRYPDGASNAEALFVDPISGDLVIVTKSPTVTRVLTAPARDLVDGATVTMVDQGRVPVGVGTLITGGDISPDGSIVLLRTYTSVLAFARSDGTDVGAALTAEPCEAPAAVEAQGEAVAFTAAGDGYLTISEGERPPIHAFGVDPAAAPPATSTTVAPTTTVVEDNTPRTPESSRAATALIVGILLVTGVAVLVWARRTRP